MIYSTNRTTSIGDVSVDVNESYFGEGSLYFMQEAAQDELALFEMAIKTDIDEVLIGESASELQALNEGFIEKTVNKIKELMRKFMEWLKGITRSALAKLNQFIIRDNAQFCKNARKMIKSMGNKKFEATGTVLVEFTIDDITDKVKKLDGLTADSMESLKSEIEKIEKDIDDTIEEMKKKFYKENVKYDLDDVMDHLNYLEGKSREEVKKTKQELDKFVKDAKDISKRADSAERKYSEDDENEKKRLAMEATAAAAFKTNAQKVVKARLDIQKKMIKIARAVVTRAAGARNEGVEYSPELIEALIESDNYEVDELLEEMSESKKSDCDDDDIEDEE